MTLTTLLALTAFLLPLQVSPGPANVYFAALGARGGVVRALPALLGYLIGVVVMTLLLVLDSAVFWHPLLIGGMQLAGGMYLLFLGWSMRKPSGEVRGSGGVQARDGLLQGALVLLLNPKAYLIVGLTLGQFAAGRAVTLPYVLAVTAVICLTFSVSFIVWAGLGAQSRALPGAWERALNFISTLAILSMGAWMTWEGLRPWLT